MPKKQKSFLGRNNLPQVEKEQKGMALDLAKSLRKVWELSFFMDPTGPIGLSWFLRW